jgi:hypothetical protein
VHCIAFVKAFLAAELYGKPRRGGACNDQSLGFPRRVDDPESQTQTNQLTRLPAPSVGLCRPAFPPSSSWPMIMTMQWLTGSGKAAANLAGRNGDHVVSGLSGRDRGERRDRGRKSKQASRSTSRGQIRRARSIDNPTFLPSWSSPLPRFLRKPNLLPCPVAVLVPRTEDCALGRNYTSPSSSNRFFARGIDLFCYFSRTSDRGGFLPLVFASSNRQRLWYYRQPEPSPHPALPI